MGRIQTNIGLITGLPITDTVDQLMALAAKPRNLLLERNNRFLEEQTAFSTVMARVLGVQFAADKLRNESLFDTKSVTSSHASISAVVDGDPVEGAYELTVLRKAQTHQMLSTGFSSKTKALGTGVLSFGFGEPIDKGLNLSELNGGAGVQRGRIKITDRSGKSAEVDLTAVETIDDVLRAINGVTDLSVKAEADGARIKLTDLTGETTSNLKVQEVAGGGTAADLGLAGVNVAEDTATGERLIGLTRNVRLATLNDGRGVRLSDTLPDLEITLRDETVLSIDFLAEGTTETTIGDILDTLNAKDPEKLFASISEDGQRLVLTDLTAGDNEFTVAGFLDSPVLYDLGLDAPAIDGVITGARVQGDLTTPLLRSLKGGQGLGELGSLSITDRSGATASVDLSAAESLSDVISAINAAGLGVRASVNDARNGLALTDTTGSFVSHLIVASEDESETAEKLDLAADTAETEIAGGRLGRQSVFSHTILKDLNGGAGVYQGSMLITDSAGTAVPIKISGEIKTVGDVIEEINNRNSKLTARISDSGDGITIEDHAGGAGVLKVTEIGGTTAADLGLLREAVTRTIGETQAQVIEGSARREITIEDGDTLEDVVAAINQANRLVRASILNSGSGANPYRISLVSQVTGKAGEIQLEAIGADFSFTELTAAQDALLLYGSASSEGAGVLASSSDNQFRDLIEGVSLSVTSTSPGPVTITVGASDSYVVSAVQAFVTQYNTLQDDLRNLTFFNQLENSTGVLFGSSEVLRVKSDLGRLITDRHFGLGSIETLASVGVEVRDDGKLTFDSAKLKQKFATSGEDLKTFFTDEQNGIAAKLYNMIETMAGEGSSLLVNRVDSLQRKIDANALRVEDLNKRLEKQRESLLLEFYRMELAIGKIQNNAAALDSMQIIEPLSFARTD